MAEAAALRRHPPTLAPPRPSFPRSAWERGGGRGGEGGLNHELRVILFSFLYVMLVLGGYGLWELASRLRLPVRRVRVPVPLAPPPRRAGRGVCRAGDPPGRRPAPPRVQAITRAGPPPSLRL